MRTGSCLPIFLLVSAALLVVTLLGFALKSKIAVRILSKQCVDCKQRAIEAEKEGKSLEIRNASGKCAKCGAAHCKASISRGCTRCGANRFIPFR